MCVCACERKGGKERERKERKNARKKRRKERRKLGQMEAAWYKAETERADEGMIKNICQHQPFIARGERAELFNLLFSAPSLFSALAAATKAECVFIREPMEMETEGRGISRSLKFGAELSLNRCLQSPLHSFQSHDPNVQTPP